jgi:LCP family protein required for cell wall assembly
MEKLFDKIRTTFHAIPRKKQIGIFLMAFFLFGIVVYAKAKPYYTFLSETLKVSPSKAVLGMYDVQQDESHINILILGIAGFADHAGTNLSDSITLASYDMETNELVTIGIPRDIWSEALRDKVNSAYAYGEAKQPGGGGMKMAKIELSSILGIPIHYVAVVSFQEFEDLINFVGGLEIDVKQSFTDERYPIKGKEDDPCVGEPDYDCRYEEISFQKGKQMMDGETALKFVRSRNSIGKEGNDFARNNRQQQVMMALKEKVIDILTSRDLDTVEELYYYLDSLVTRDITNEEALAMARHIGLHSDFSHRTEHLPNGLFEVPEDWEPYDWKYVLIPRDNNHKKLHTYMDCMITDKKDYICDEVKAVVERDTEE